MKRVKESIKLIVGIIIGIVIGLSVTVGAVTLISSNNVTYSNSNNSATDVKGALDDLYSKSTLSNLVKPGDYIKMTPTKTSYIISKELTGYTLDQTINPSELNIWRVLKVNKDGSIDAISDNVSSKNIYIQGETGYKKYIKMLNTTAASYENSKYTIGSRHFGYNKQTLEITSSLNTSTFLNNHTSSYYRGNLFLDENTGYDYDEKTGHGDDWYLYDVGLVLSALGQIVPDLNSASSGSFLAGRYYICGATYDSCNFSYIETSAMDGIYALSLLDGTTSSSYANSIRPILILKPNITSFTGNGTKESPYILS